MAEIYTYQNGIRDTPYVQGEVRAINFSNHEKHVCLNRGFHNENRETTSRIKGTYTPKTRNRQRESRNQHREWRNRHRKSRIEELTLRMEESISRIKESTSRIGESYRRSRNRHRGSRIRNRSLAS